MALAKGERGLAIAVVRARCRARTHAWLGTSADLLRRSRSVVSPSGAPDKVVSATVIMLEEEDFAGMNEEWLSLFPIDPPARQDTKLPVRVPGMKISVAVIAEA